MIRACIWAVKVLQQEFQPSAPSPARDIGRKGATPKRVAQYLRYENNGVGEDTVIQKVRSEYCCDLSAQPMSAQTEIWTVEVGVTIRMMPYAS